MSKRTIILISSISLTIYLAAIPLFPKDLSQISVGVFVVVSGIFAGICLWEDLSGIEFITLLTLPVIFSLGMGSIILQFPNFSRFFNAVFLAVYFLVFYVLLLSLNIFNVASQKSIPLLRAAYTTSFLVTTFTIFPIFTLIYKINLNLFWESFLVLAVVVILSFQSLWTVFLPKNVIKTSLKASFIISALMVQTALVFSFFPLESFFRSLLLSTFFYIYLGFAHQYLRKTLKIKTIIEYSVVGLIIVGLVLLY